MMKSVWKKTKDGAGAVVGAIGAAVTLAVVVAVMMAFDAAITDDKTEEFVIVEESEQKPSRVRTLVKTEEEEGYDVVYPRQTWSD